MADSSTDRIYLDHNATTPAFPEVVEAMRACWSEPYLNPASQHEFGRRARRVLENARDQIAELLGANTNGPSPDRVIFTSGGTESNNLALHGLIQRAGASPPPPTNAPFQPAHIIVSPIEHPSIATLANYLSKNHVHVDNLAVTPNGTLRLDDLPQLIQPNTRLVAAMLANNETGVLQPITELARICNNHNIPLHTDAAQAAAKLPLNFRELGAATMSIAAHKFGGPIGIGALIVRGDIHLSPLLLGGVQQAGLRPGTESVALAVGMRVALELWESNRREWLAHLEGLRNEFESSLLSNVNPGHSEAQRKACQPIVIGAHAPRLPNTSNIAFVGLDRQQLFLALDQAGIACSTGSACASGSSEPSSVHVAMACDPGVISSALRFSFGVTTTRDEVREAASRITQICGRFHSQKQA